MRISLSVFSLISLLSIYAHGTNSCLSECRNETWQQVRNLNDERSTASEDTEKIVAQLNGDEDHDAPLKEKLAALKQTNTSLEESTLSVAMAPDICAEKCANK